MMFTRTTTTLLIALKDTVEVLLLWSNRNDLQVEDFFYLVNRLSSLITMTDQFRLEQKQDYDARVAYFRGNKGFEHLADRLTDPMKDPDFMNLNLVSTSLKLILKEGLNDLTLSEMAMMLTCTGMEIDTMMRSWESA